MDDFYGRSARRPNSPCDNDLAREPPFRHVRQGTTWGQGQDSFAHADIRSLRWSENDWYSPGQKRYFSESYSRPSGRLGEDSPRASNHRSQHRPPPPPAAPPIPAVAAAAAAAHSRPSSPVVDTPSSPLPPPPKIPDEFVVETAAASTVSTSVNTPISAKPRPASDVLKALHAPLPVRQSKAIAASRIAAVGKFIRRDQGQDSSAEVPVGDPNPTEPTVVVKAERVKNACEEHIQACKHIAIRLHKAAVNLEEGDVQRAIATLMSMERYIKSTRESFKQLITKSIESDSILRVPTIAFWGARATDEIGVCRQVRQEVHFDHCQIERSMKATRFRKGTKWSKR